MTLWWAIFFQFHSFGRLTLFNDFSVQKEINSYKGISYTWNFETKLYTGSFDCQCHFNSIAQSSPQFNFYFYFFTEIDEICTFLLYTLLFNKILILFLGYTVIHRPSLNKHFSTEHLTATNPGNSARTSATCSLASSRESSTSNPGVGPYRYQFDQILTGKKKWKQQTKINKLKFQLSFVFRLGFCLNILHYL